MDRSGNTAFSNVTVDTRSLLAERPVGTNLGHAQPGREGASNSRLTHELAARNRPVASALYHLRTPCDLALCGAPLQSGASVSCIHATNLEGSPTPTSLTPPDAGTTDGDAISPVNILATQPQKSVCRHALRAGDASGKVRPGRIAAKKPASLCDIRLQCDVPAGG